MEHVYEFCHICEVLHMLHVIFVIAQKLPELFVIGQMLNLYEYGAFEKNYISYM